MSDFDPRKLPNRPNTPLPVGAFDFLLDRDRLEKHLSEDKPDPGPSQLIIQFLDKAIKSDAQTLKWREKTLKLLALQVAAFLKWDLEFLTKNISLTMMNMLLMELLMITDPIPPTDQELEAPPEPTGVYYTSLILYHRWCVRVVLDTSIPSKPTKTNRVMTPPGVTDVLPTENVNARDAVIGAVNEKIQESVEFLNMCLTQSKETEMHSTASIRQLPSQHQLGTGEDLDDSLLWSIDTDDILCQIKYDLACYYFHTQQVSKAAPLFFQIETSLFSETAESWQYCKINKAKLVGYCTACRGQALMTEQQKTLRDRLHDSHLNGYKDLVEVLLEDNCKNELYSTVRDHLEITIDDNALLFHVIICNSIRNMLKGDLISPLFYRKLATATNSDVEFILDALERCVPADMTSEIKNKAFQFIKLVKQHCAHIDIESVLQRTHLPELLQRSSTESFSSSTDTVPLKLSQYLNKPLNTAAWADTPNICMAHLERELSYEMNPHKIRDIIVQVHKLDAGRDLSYICGQVILIVPRDYDFLIRSADSAVYRNLLHIYIYKAFHSLECQMYEQAKELINSAIAIAQVASFRLSKALLSELLLLNLLTLEHGSISDSTELQKQVSSYLFSRQPESLERAPVTETCVAYYLNRRKWSEITEMSKERLYRIGYVTVAAQVSNICLNESRKNGRDLFETIRLIFNPQKRTDPTQPGPDMSVLPLNKQLFDQFITKIKDEKALNVLLAVVVKLYNLVKDSIHSISSNLSAIWPDNIRDTSSFKADQILSTLMSVLNHSLSIVPNQPYWLRTQADLAFADGAYWAALHFYTESAIHISNYFQSPVPKSLWSDLVIRNMVKCCQQLKSFTQAAILCQFLEHVDYSTAFKALSERHSYDGCELYYKYIWDVTILEFLIYIHTRNQESSKKKIALSMISQPELNSNNSVDVLNVTIINRKQQFLQALAQHFIQN